VDYTIKRAGVFVLRLALPADFRVESVTGADIGSGLKPMATAGSGSGFETENARACALQINLVKGQKELARTLDVPGVHPLGTVKLTGYVIVSAE